MWHGADNDSIFTQGWALCNGQNGTPDLRDRFVVGRRSQGLGSYNAGQIGGEATKTLGTANLPSHTHTDGTLAATGGNHTHSFSGSGSNTHSHGIPRGAGGADADITPYVADDVVEYIESSFSSDSATINFTISGTTGGSGNLSLGVDGVTGDQGGTMGQSFDIIPPYYAIAYIMRIS
jgi:microcystin-dependent protein